MGEKLTLKDFDDHLERYLKVMGKPFSLRIFYKQFKMCYYGNRADFLKTYNYFKANSRHIHNKQLTFLQG